MMDYLDAELTRLKAEYLRKWRAKIMEKYQCSVHGEVTDVMWLDFDSSILRDPDTHAYTRIAKVYCIACYVAFLDLQLGEVTEIVANEQEELTTD